MRGDIIIKNLNLGLYEEDPIKREVIKEILNHQGLSFDICNENNFSNYQIIVSTKKIHSQDIKKKFIIIDDTIINTFFNALSGNINLNEKERINSVLSQYELVILNNVINSYENLKLPFLRKWYWPDFKRICVLLIHDIDDIDIFPGIEFKRELLKYFFNHLLFKNYGNNINEILKMENEKNFTSTFFFFSKYKRKIQSFIGAKKNHKNLMENVLNNKREIGLHGSSNAALSKYTMEKEKMELENIINLKINGYRQHLLNYVFKIPDTINYLSQLNLLYDISINDNDIFGFMKGICFPYHPIIYEKKINLVEISVPYEDWISLSRKFTYNNQIDIINELFETTKKYNGCLTLCIHNNYININKYKDFYNLYSYILNNLQNDYWVTSVNECVKWWIKRENANIRIYYDKNKIIFNSDTELPIEIFYKNKKIYKIIKNDTLEL